MKKGTIAKWVVIQLLELVTVGIICLLLSMVDFDVDSPVAWRFLFTCIFVGVVCGAGAYMLKHPYRVMRNIYASIVVISAFLYRNIGIRGEVCIYAYKLYRKKRSYSAVYYSMIDRYNRAYYGRRNVRE